MTARRGALPEFALYVDDGCEEAPHCLECPLSQCRYDVQGGARQIRNVDRNADIRSAYAAGEAAPAIAERLGISKRTVWRAVKADWMTE